MHRLIIVFIYLLLNTGLFGQKSEIENLINQIKSEVVPPNFEYYNLVDVSSSTYFDENSLEKHEIIALLQNHPNFPLDSFIEKSKNCILLNWTDFDLNKAEIYSAETLSNLESQTQFYTLLPDNTPQSSLDTLEKTKKHNELIVLIKKSWSKKRIAKEVSKAWKIHSKNTKAENKIRFSFSSPLIIGNYAMITLAKSGSSATYLFYREDDAWTKILTFNIFAN